MTDDWNGLAREVGFRDERHLLEYFYVEERLPISVIAQKLGCGPATVANRLTKHGIPKRRRGGANNSQRLWRKLFRLDQRLVFTTSNEDLALLLHCSASVVYKYKRTVTGGGPRGV